MISARSSSISRRSSKKLTWRLLILKRPSGGNHTPATRSFLHRIRWHGLLKPPVSTWWAMQITMRSTGAPKEYQAPSPDWIKRDLSTWALIKTPQNGQKNTLISLKKRELNWLFSIILMEQMD